MTTLSRRLSALESEVSGHHEFGDSGAISRQVHARSRQRLVDVAERVPAARRLAEVLGPPDGCVARDVLTDTVIRCAIGHSHAHLRRPRKRGLSLDQCGAVLDAATDHLRTQHHWTPQLCSGRPQDRFVGDRRGWVWSPGAGHPVFERSFRELVDQEYGDPLHSPDATAMASLRHGHALLQELLPELSTGALSHVATIALFSPLGRGRQCTSSSQFRLTGTVFVSPGALADPWQVCEVLLHESLHQKFYDLRHISPLFRPAQEIDRPGLLSPPWKRSGAEGAPLWNVFRAFAAFHVYVHLALLGLRVADSPDGPARSRVTSSRTAIERARYLGEDIERRCWVELDTAGHRLHGWLTTVLDALDP